MSRVEDYYLLPNCALILGVAFALALSPSGRGQLIKNRSCMSLERLVLQTLRSN